MRIVSYSTASGPGFGTEEKGVVTELGRTLKEALGSEGLNGHEFVERYRAGGGGQKIHRLDDIDLQPPVPEPPKLLCISDNYLEHIREFGGDVSDVSGVTPQVFFKPPSTTLRAPGEALIIPSVSRVVDWEIELAVIIGRRGKYIPVDRAYNHVLGYSIFNDISDREVEIWKRDEDSTRPWDPYFDWLMGKCMDGFAPMGPCVVTADEIGNPMDLNISLTLNGEVMQQAKTGQMIVHVPRLISYISHVMTLEPGDIIATGTPPGVGVPRGRTLQAGDLMIGRIDEIGTLRTPVEQE